VACFGYCGLLVLVVGNCGFCFCVALWLVLVFGVFILILGFNVCVGVLGELCCFVIWLCII